MTLFGSDDKSPASAGVICSVVTKIHSSLYLTLVWILFFKKQKVKKPKNKKRITPSCTSLSARLAEKNTMQQKSECGHLRENVTYLFPRCTDTGYPGSCTPRCSSGPEDKYTHVTGHMESVLFLPRFPPAKSPFCCIDKVFFFFRSSIEYFHSESKTHK